MQYKPKTAPRRPRRNEDELEDEGKTPVFAVMSQPVAMSYKVHINKAFESVEQFENIVHILDHASPNDVVEIKLSTDGGALHAVLPMLAAMANTNAQVLVHAVSDVASAGTFLLMMADDVYINPYVTVMFHQVTFGTGGQGNRVEDHVAHVMKSSKALIRDMYKDFFSPEEIESMLTGKEFWLTKDDFDVRYEARNQRQEAQEAAERAAQEAATEKPRKRATKPAVE
jgi:ATP-dependent protease ClpP protease subunit